MSVEMKRLSEAPLPPLPPDTRMASEVMDKGMERWRFAEGRLCRYIRYAPHKAPHSEVQIEAIWQHPDWDVFTGWRKAA